MAMIVVMLCLIYNHYCNLTISKKSFGAITAKRIVFSMLTALKKPFLKSLDEKKTVSGIKNDRKKMHWKKMCEKLSFSKIW